ncbi:hypothetical protein HHK36_011818 [Tetracentron sinense]|uniref:Protein FAR1-RELATED SEQUENCE n=1 Tax=Tetracentron sinense TaxID=13715 RepID=A0A835DKT3_TETSI|nr:hypothetical protein HHK36_011818 [Tetracentron sinense]
MAGNKLILGKKKIERRTQMLKQISASVDFPGRGILKQQEEYPCCGSEGHENLHFGERDVRNYVGVYKRLKLAEGDAEAMHIYFTRMQQRNSNFFYLMDLDNEGHLRNVFWADARSRAAYGYFGDVVTFDTTYLTNRYDMSFAPFVGVNHHGQSVLLGCGLLADETIESFIWMFKAWLIAMSGRPPNAIITNQCKTMQRAIAEVFPKAHHRLCLWHIMKKISDKLGRLREYKEVKKAMKNVVYESLRIRDFEMAWESMIKQYSLEHNEWLTILYEVRRQWVPVFLKDTFFAGMSTTQRSESMNSFFDGYVHAKISLKEFVDQYDSALRNKYEKEAQADFESFYTKPVLKTHCYFEVQIAEIYTREMFMKFQEEVCGMVCCSKSVVKVDGSIITFAVKERVIGKNGKNGKMLGPKVYEVLFNTSEVEVRCICNLFEHKGPPKVGKPHDTQLIAIETQHFADEHSTQEGIRQTEHYSLTTDLRLSNQGHLGLVAQITPNFGNHCNTQDNIHLKGQIAPTYSSLDVPERIIDIQPNMQWGNQQREDVLNVFQEDVLLDDINVEIS